MAEATGIGSVLAGLAAAGAAPGMKGTSAVGRSSSGSNPWAPAVVGP